MPQDKDASSTDQAVDILARTIWGEARGEGAAGMAAVAAVIMNRAKRPGWWGRDVRSVCQAKWQFSCWNANDPNRAKLLSVGPVDKAFAAALDIAELAVRGLPPDPTAGATHYHTRAVSPAWAKGKTPCAMIGAHLFYNDIE